MATDNQNYNHAIKVGAWANEMKRAIQTKWNDEDRLVDAGLSDAAKVEILGAHDLIISAMENNIPTLEESQPASESD